MTASSMCVPFAPGYAVFAGEGRRQSAWWAKTRCIATSSIWISVSWRSPRGVAICIALDCNGSIIRGSTQEFALFQNKKGLEPNDPTQRTRDRELAHKLH